MSTKKEPYRMVVEDKVYFTPKDTIRILTDTESKRVNILSCLNDDDISEITEKLQYHASWCYGTIRNLGERPNPQAVKKTLEDLKKKADKFQKCLNELDDYTKYFCLNGLDRLVGLTICNAEMISDGAKEALKKVETPENSERSARSSSKRINFIAHLIGIYETSTGRVAGFSRPPDGGKPGGPFVRFVTGCLKQVGDDVGEEAIVKSIQEARDRIKGLSNSQHKKYDF